MIKYFLIAFFSFFIVDVSIARSNGSRMDSLLNRALLEIEQLELRWKSQEEALQDELYKIESKIKTTSDANVLITLVLKRDSIKDKWERQNLARTNEIRKIRYLKGVQIINLLYQKTLALDHHFSSVATLSEIHRMSNPNEYPEFVRIRDRLKSPKRSKPSFDPQPILQSNVYTSVIFSLVEAFIQPKKEKNLTGQNSEDLSCIIDFTSRMHQDLKNIYYETFYLKRSNAIISQDMEQLFLDFTRPIGFGTSLHLCYTNDLWEELQTKLNDYVDNMHQLAKEQPLSSKLDRMQIELDFPIDRLMQFLYSYNSFIEEGTRFYEKFGSMLDDYQNKIQCKNQIPLSYFKLKDQIRIAVEKFRTAYLPVEIHGSKYKELLYGLNEFD